MKVIVFGGTHGNEWTGVMVVTQYAEEFREKYPALDLNFVFANPEAHKLNRRFKDEDLNRAFQFLSEERPTSYEHHRAQELKSLIDDAPCFVIDLHTTTSNMGKTVILCHDHPLNLRISEELTQKLSDCRVILSPDPNKKYLASQSEMGMMIEVGPVANGLIEPKVLEGTLAILDGILSALATPMQGLKKSVEVYEEIQDVHYPKSETGNPSAYIHSDFQGKDFSPLSGEYTPFKTFSGVTLKEKTAEKLYPIFINEAAYYPQQLAYTLCRKRILNY